METCLNTVKQHKIGGRGQESAVERGIYGIKHNIGTGNKTKKKIPLSNEWTPK
jgi:hypothetical protein